MINCVELVEARLIVSYAYSCTFVDVGKAVHFHDHFPSLDIMKQFLWCPSPGPAVTLMVYSSAYYLKSWAPCNALKIYPKNQHTYWEHREQAWLKNLQSHKRNGSQRTISSVGAVAHVIFFPLGRQEISCEPLFCRFVPGNSRGKMHHLTVVHRITIAPVLEQLDRANIVIKRNRS